MSDDNGTNREALDRMASAARQITSLLTIPKRIADLTDIMAGLIDIVGEHDLALTVARPSPSPLRMLPGFETSRKVSRDDLDGATNADVALARAIGATTVNYTPDGAIFELTKANAVALAAVQPDPKWPNTWPRISVELLTAYRELRDAAKEQVERDPGNGRLNRALIQIGLVDPFK